MSRFLRAPLLHFLLLGIIFFGLYSRFGNEPDTESQQIVVSAQQIELLQSLWEKQWRRPPTPQELDGLVES